MKNCYAMIRKDRINKKGESPILVRIVVDNHSTYISTGLKIKPDQWNEKKQLPKNTFPNSTAAKHLIENYINKVKGIFYDLDRTNKRKSSKDIKDMVINNNSDSLILFIKSWIDGRKTRKEITHSTHLKYSGIVDKLEKTFGNKVKISDFDVEFLKEYDHALRTKFKNSTNTIASNFSFLRTVSNTLIQDDKMELNNYPFKKWKLKFEEVKRKYLTPEQIKSIEQTILLKGSKIELSKKYFCSAIKRGLGLVML